MGKSLNKLAIFLAILYFSSTFGFIAGIPISEINKLEETEAVIGGDEITDMKDFYYLVQVEAPLKVPSETRPGRVDIKKSVCGGILFRERYVLTAAHCVMDWNDAENKYKEWKNTVVRVGHHTWGRGREIGVEKFDWPELYGDSPHHAHDIAVLTLKKIVKVEGITPIELPTVAIEGGETGIFAGWGRSVENFNRYILPDGKINTVEVNKHPILDEKLHSVSLKKVRDLRCYDIYGDELVNDYFCAIHPQHLRGPFDGDSGSPLIIRRNGKNFVVGLMAEGLADTWDPDSPAMFSDVYYHLEFINGVLGRQVNNVPTITLRYVQRDRMFA